MHCCNTSCDDMTEATTTTTTTTNAGQKRSHDDVPMIPDGFKEHNDRLVYKTYCKLDLVKTPIKSVYFSTMDDDTTDVKYKVYVNLDDLDEQDQMRITEVNEAIKECAKLQNNVKHATLINEAGEVKLTIYAKFAKRKKQAILKNDHAITAGFMFSSVFSYMGWYGVNLIVPKKDKKVTISKIKVEVDVEEEE